MHVLHINVMMKTHLGLGMDSQNGCFATIQANPALLKKRSHMFNVWIRNSESMRYHVDVEVLDCNHSSFRALFAKELFAFTTSICLYPVFNRLLNLCYFAADNWVLLLGCIFTTTDSNNLLKIIGSVGDNCSSEIRYSYKKEFKNLWRLNSFCCSFAKSETQT